MDDVPYSFVITTVKGKDFQFECQNCADVRELVIFFLDGLKTRSKYAVAMQSNPEKGCWWWRWIEIFEIQERRFDHVG